MEVRTSVLLYTQSLLHSVAACRKPTNTHVVAWKLQSYYSIWHPDNHTQRDHTGTIRCIWHIFWTIRLFLVSFWLLPVLKCLKRAKNSLIFQKKYQMYTNFSYESIFCTSSMYEICLYFHWLYFSSIEFRTFMNIQTRKINK